MVWWVWLRRFGPVGLFGTFGLFSLVWQVWLGRFCFDRFGMVGLVWQDLGWQVLFGRFGMVGLVFQIWFAWFGLQCLVQQAGIGNLVLVGLFYRFGLIGQASMFTMVGLVWQFQFNRFYFYINSFMTLPEHQKVIFKLFRSDGETRRRDGHSDYKATQPS